MERLRKSVYDAIEIERTLIQQGLTMDNVTRVLLEGAGSYKSCVMLTDVRGFNNIYVQVPSPVSYEQKPAQRLQATIKALRFVPLELAGGSGEVQGFNPSRFEVMEDYELDEARRVVTHLMAPSGCIVRVIGLPDRIRDSFEMKKTLKELSTPGTPIDLGPPEPAQ